MYDQWAGFKLASVAAVRKPDDDGWAQTVDFRQIFTTQEAVNITDNRGGGPKGHLGKKIWKVG